MSASTGLFQIDLYQIDELVPARADLATDPLGQVVAVIWAYLPEGMGSNLYSWYETAYLRADFAREKVELVRAVEGEYSVEGEWDLDTREDEVRDYLLLFSGDEPDEESFATLARGAPDLKIAPPGPDVREFWGDDTSFRDGVPSDDWAEPSDDD